MTLLHPDTRPYTPIHVANMLGNILDIGPLPVRFRSKSLRWEITPELLAIHLKDTLPEHEAENIEFLKDKEGTLRYDPQNPCVTALLGGVGSSLDSLINNVTTFYAKDSDILFYSHCIKL